MKISLVLILIVIISHCSFDTKTGIWKNVNEINYEKTKRFEGFETLFEKERKFDKIIKPSSSLKILLASPKINLKWTDEYYQNSNNLENFNYKNSNDLIFTSQKLTRYKTNDNIFFDGENIITTDIKGNIIVYSLTNQQIIFKYNFYKKKFKKIEKDLNIYIQDKIIYVGDNLGYLYSLDFINKKLLWAKNYKVPFRSNLKIINEKLILADNNNMIYFINKMNGERIKFIPTEESIIKNNFISSLATQGDTLFYLNTYGSLYSLSSNADIKWFVNLNDSIVINPGNLFYSNPIVIYDDKIIILTNQNLYILDKNSGSTISKSSISSKIQPIVSNKYLFLITENNLLVCIDLDNNEKIYSVKISQQIANFLETKSRPIFIKTFSVLNNRLFIFLKNSYVVKFSINGVIEDIFKLPKKINSLPIYINKSIVYLNNKNKVIIFD
tara:strand:+ start:4429 stop:5751 length:1323 start_codon:yes stop_codon:yes gene_type:complete